jgi:hypothetical protein
VNVGEIVYAAVPVLCVDTCAVLDLMRDPTRETALPRIRKAGLDLVDLAEQGGLAILLADQVALEFAANEPDVREEASRALRKLRQQVERLDELAGVYGAKGTAEMGHLDDHVDRARAVVARLMDVAICVTPSNDIPGRAMVRVNEARAPAAKGKESFKDCVVFETYLEAGAQLRAGGCQAPIVFVSSNPKEYFEPGGGSVLKADIAHDLGIPGMAFAVSMEHAKNALGL